MKEYIYVGERKKLVEKDIIDKVKKGILVPSNSGVWCSGDIE